jgi:D-alanine-D-alanine ligase
MMQVVILAGGLSHERDVSEKSGRRLAEALRDIGHDVVVKDTDATLLKFLSDTKPDVVIPMLHGAAGEDGTLRDVLSALQIPYVGSTPDACRVSFDKPVAKSIVAATGIRVPTGVALPHATFRELGADSVMAAVLDRVGLPAMVKPARGGSAQGANIVTEPSQLPSALVGAFAYGEVAVIERFIEGTEVAASVIETEDGLKVLPIVEILPDSGFYDYHHRYTAGITEFFCPTRLDETIVKRIETAAKTIHSSLGLRDFSRSDLIVDKEGEIWFIEVNVAPGLTETSLFPQSAEASEAELGMIFDSLIKRAVKRGN